MESWRKVWREGVSPQLSSRALEALEHALETDDPTLLQGATTSPPPLQCVIDWPAEAACMLGYCGWKGEDLETVGEVEEYFARICFASDTAMKEPAAVRWLINWFDDTPRDEMRQLLLAEVRLSMADRERGQLAGV